MDEEMELMIESMKADLEAKDDEIEQLR